MMINFFKKKQNLTCSSKAFCHKRKIAIKIFSLGIVLVNIYSSLFFVRNLIAFGRTLADFFLVTFSISL